MEWGRQTSLKTLNAFGKHATFFLKAVTNSHDYRSEHFHTAICTSLLNTEGRRKCEESCCVLMNWWLRWAFFGLLCHKMRLLNMGLVVIWVRVHWETLRNCCRSFSFSQSLFTSSHRAYKIQCFHKRMRVHIWGEISMSQDKREVIGICL